MSHEHFQGLKLSVESTAVEIIHKKLPEQIVETDKIIEAIRELETRQKAALLPSLEEILLSKANSENNHYTKRSRTESDASIKPNKVPSLPVPSNKEIVKYIKIINEKLTYGIELLGTVKTWIQLNIPRIEDGNNFGVAVQEECVSELNRVEDSGFSVMESTSKYYQNRARLVRKMLKHPYIEDYRQSVIECDESQIAILLMNTLELRNNYAVVHDMMLKNYEKLVKPRSHHTHNMY